MGGISTRLLTDRRKDTFQSKKVLAALDYKIKPIAT